MKLKTTIILMILGFLIFASLCICKKPSTEGLDTMKTNTHILRRGEYITDASYMKSEDGSYVLSLWHGRLVCWIPYKGMHWNMNLKGSKIMLLNDNGIIQFKTSREGKPITTPMSTGSVTGSSLVLTSYGTLELKSGSNGEGDTLFTYPVKEGLTPDEADGDVSTLMTNLDTDRTNLTKRVVQSLDSHFTDPNNGATGRNLPDGINYDKWKSFRDTVYTDTNEPGGSWSSTAKSKAEDVDINTDIIPNGNHNKLLENGRKLRRLQNTLDSKVKVLNQLGDSHVTEKQMHLDSTVFISLAWTVVASSLVYYTLTQ